MKRGLMVGAFIISSLLFASNRGPIAGIFQLVETRAHQTSCWGVIIQLDKMTFKESIEPGDLGVKEAKHAGELKDAMVWTVDKSNKRLTIKFKEGMGDFGSGNAVTIALGPRAFAGACNETFTASISTDPF